MNLGSKENWNDEFKLTPEDMRSTYSKFVRAAEDVKREMENPRSEDWAHDISLRNFNEDLSYIYALNNIL